MFISKESLIISVIAAGCLQILTGDGCAGQMVDCLCLVEERECVGGGSWCSEHDLNQRAGDRAKSELHTASTKL